MGRPPIDVIRQHFQSNWDIKHRATISEIWDGRHLLVILDSEEDMVAALTCPLRKIQHAMFRLFRYTADYNHKLESKTTTKWIRLPGLPPPFYHRSYIGAIVNSFAYFLDTDERTKACASMRYARACIECDVTIPLPEKVWVGLPNNKGFWQEIQLEGNMSYCAYCKIHGHELANCRKKNPPSNYDSHKEQTSSSRERINKKPFQEKNLKSFGLDTQKKDTVVQEWKKVETKKAAKRNNTNPGYGPDVLYANTTPTENSTIQNLTAENTESNTQQEFQKDNEDGILAITHTKTSKQTTPDEEASERQYFLSDSQLIKDGIKVLESIEKGDIDKYSPEEKQSIKERMTQMVNRVTNLKDQLSDEHISVITEDIPSHKQTFPNDA